eukprot:CAMPEP_0170544250 /NCGR_PEP_ID=MMETSP0211-20121228/3089_1 /TAXON_ID=311385 /ORGANISM="Pseudokeronopsis sp., Strain OXSARD2" /LENGTH=87 /DNA_ID=CAMNT_0010847861 /DNA_START=656 /DNA_END=919 /DNA_ORIENTATION=+
MSSTQGSTFSKTPNRFKIPCYKGNSPGPGEYKPKANLGEESPIYKRNTINSFPRNPRNEINRFLCRNRDLPGPGQYENPSEFGGQEV